MSALATHRDQETGGATVSAVVEELKTHLPASKVARPAPGA